MGLGCNPCQILVHAHSVHVHVIHDDAGGAVQTGLHLATGKFFVDRGSLSYMSAHVHVLLNFLNTLRLNNKMRRFAEHLIVFPLQVE